jgi:23S rRNA (uracil1939-C5)-methyltransferase
MSSTHSKSQIPLCSHFGECAGCSENLSSSPPPVWGEMLSFFLPSIQANLHQGPSLHWRHRTKMAVRGTARHPLIGLFKRSSHQVFPIPSCLVHHPQLNHALNSVRLWMCEQALIPYEEKTGQGELRYLQAVVQRGSGRVQLAFVLNFNKESPQVNRWRMLIHELGQNNPTLWHSLWINFNDRSTNTIFGPHWSYIWGEEYLWESFGEVAVCYGPASFGQANLPLFEHMLSRIRELLPKQACVAEFYAGVGAIGLFIASSCQWVRCSEINPHAEAYFNQARSRLPPSVATRLTFVPGATQTTLSILHGASTVIVDPPRKGLDPHFFSALKDAVGVQRLLYISCGWEAFVRDCQKLCAQGWEIQSVDGYLFFPGSNHVELLVCFDRAPTVNEMVID